MTLLLAMVVGVSGTLFEVQLFAWLYCAGHVKKRRDRDWTPAEITATQAAVTPQGLRLCRSCHHFLGGSMGGREPGRFHASGFPVVQPVEPPPPLGLGCVGFSKPKPLEAMYGSRSRVPRIF